MEYCIVSDDSGHEYVCPYERRFEAMDAFYAIGEYWYKDLNETVNTPPPPEPDYVTRIDGGRLVFKDWRIE